MTRFAGHSDITNFLQRNQFADKVGAAGMSAYADQAIGGFFKMRQ
jgi:glutamine synthetase